MQWYQQSKTASMKQSHIIINLNWDTLESCKTEQKNYQETILFYVPILAFEWTVAILLCTYVFAILAYIF